MEMNEYSSYDLGKLIFYKNGNFTLILISLIYVNLTYYLLKFFDMT